MVDTGAGAKKIFRWVKQICILDMYIQVCIYFGLKLIVNVYQDLTKSLLVSALQGLDKNLQELKHLYGRVVTCLECAS